MSHPKSPFAWDNTRCCRTDTLVNLLSRLYLSWNIRTRVRIINSSFLNLVLQLFRFLWVLRLTIVVYAIIHIFDVYQNIWGDVAECSPWHKTHTPIGRKLPSLGSIGRFGIFAQTSIFNIQFANNSLSFLGKPWNLGRIVVDIHLLNVFLITFINIIHFLWLTVILHKLRKFLLKCQKI